MRWPSLFRLSSASSLFVLFLALCASCAQVVGADFGDYEVADDDGGSGGTGTGTTSNGGNGGGPSNGGGPAGGASPVNSVLVVYAMSGSPDDGLLLRGALEGLGFPTVDAYEGGDADPPTLDVLNAYDAVLVATRTPFKVGFEVQLETALVDYFNGGGKLVVAAATFCSGVGAIGGPLPDILAFQGGALNPPGGSLGTVHQPSPLFDGVGDLGSMLNFCSGGLAPGATSVADYQSGPPLVATIEQNGRTRVDINAMYVGSDPALEQLFANALRFVD